MPFKLSIADSTDATITGARSTGACNTLLPAVMLSAPVLAANNTSVTSTGANIIQASSNGHSGTVFRVLCPKISTGQEKLAPTGRHGRHVFATLSSTSHIYWSCHVKKLISSLCP